MARETINGISVPIPGTGEPADFQGDLRRFATDLPASFARVAPLVDGLVEPMIFSHRGGVLRFPEESMEGFVASAEAGFVVEVDLQPLSDGTLVPCHDSTVTRTMTGISGTVVSNNLSQWRAAKIKPVVKGGRSAQPVTWSQVLDVLGGRCVFAVELKSPTGADEDNFFESVIERGLTRSVILQSSSQALCERAVAHGMEALLTASTTAADPVAVKAAGINFIGPGGAAATSAYVGACAAAGLKVIPYTFNTTADFTEKLGWGAAGIFTDDGWRLTNAYAPVTIDSFAGGHMWPSNDGQNEGLQAWAPEEGAFMIGDGINPSAVYRRLGQFGKGATVGRYQFDVQFMPYASNQARFFALWIGEKGNDLCYADGGRAGDTDPACQGYHFLVRRNGSKEIYYVSGTTKTAIATHSSVADSFAPAATKGPRLTFEVEITASDVTLRCLTDGTQVTVAHTGYRGTTGAFLSGGNNGTQVLLHEVRVNR